MAVKYSRIRTVCCMLAVVIGAAAASGLFAQSAESPGATEQEVSFWAELAFWDAVKESSNPEELRAYLAAYPDGRFASLARVRIEALTDQAPVDIPTTPVQQPTGAQLTDGLQPGGIFQDCEVCPQMVVIPAGSFEMGSDVHRPEERPQHLVTIAQPFAIGTHEVTVDEWDACLREGACRQSPQSGREGRLPMANVSWDNAQNYLKWLSEKTDQKYRLPTEAEWEYAARAGSRTSYWWGDEKGAKRANCADCGNPSDGRDASPAGSFEPNPFGLYDVHGNVWEWTQDCWNPSYAKAPGDGAAWMRGDCLSRVLRGGSWALDHQYMRSSRRNRYDRDVRYYLNGFRVVREVPALAAAPPGDGLMPLESTLLAAVDKVFANAPQSAPGAAPQTFVIDPLIDGLSGMESVATRAMESMIVERVRANHKRFAVREFSELGTAGPQYLVIGTFTGVNKQRETGGERVAFRICLVLLDLESGRVVSKAKLFSQAAGVDITPSGFFRDSPAWVADPPVQAYIRTCQATKPGDPIDPLYLAHIRAATLIEQAILAYEQGQYGSARELFERVSGSEGGNQLRTLNGLYLTNWRLGQMDQAAEAFANIVNYGLDNQRLGIRFEFRPGSIGLLASADDRGEYQMWLAQIARVTARRKECLEIVGHSHRAGPELLNQRLSLRRAEYVKRRLEENVPELSTRMIAVGRGAEENLIGSGTADARDALDRRIVFDAIKCLPSE